MSMPVLESPTAMRAWSDEQRRHGRRIGLVPTMGALHEGHMTLVDEARRHCDVVVVSIFVNPLQFNRRDDFDCYPRPIDDDLVQCDQAGVDAVYAPTAEAMYATGFDTHVEPGALAATLEGAGRPGHFRGVATVVTKLFNAARPDIAVFGEKDYQQLAIIRRMVLDLDMGIVIAGVATVREPDRLAMSSRNRRLSAAQRDAAMVVPEALAAMETAYRRGDARADELCDIATRVVANEPLARLEYVGVIDAATLRPLDHATDGARAVIAVWFDDIRLIDNLALSIS